MTQQTINIGNQPGDGTGDPARTAFTKVNQNFTEVYANATPGGSVGQIQYKLAGTSFGGFTASGDATINTTTGVITVPLVNNLAASSGSSLVGFLQSGVSAVARTAQAKFRDTVSVMDFGAMGDGTTDDTAAIQAAINSGYSLVFPAGTYKCANLTQSTNFQRFYAYGQVNLSKNANGTLLTSSGTYVEFNGLQFLGTGYTGDNIVCSGNNPRFLNCSSYGTSGRALKATGSHVQIIGTCGIYATTDATATGYDIEIGVSGTATLYHELYGVYSSQSTGGILLTDTGSHHIVGGQFGKLTIASGTAPAGSNGGMTVGARILGDVTVNLANSVFSGNQFSTLTITLGTGTSQHSLDSSNNLVNTTIVNNGNANSPVVKSIGTGSPSGIVLQYGSDSFNSTVRYADNAIYHEDASLVLPNNKSLRFFDTTGTEYAGVLLSSTDDWTFGANNGANFTNISSGTVGIFAVVAGTNIVQFYSSGLRPSTDNTLSNGTSTLRWSQTYSTNFRPGAGTATWTSGAGTPEASVTATVGSLYTRTDGGAATTLYVKETGSGNTGWVAK